MAFKMKSKAELFGFNEKYSQRMSLVYEKSMPKNVWGKINPDGSILVNNRLDDKQKKQTVKHERVHLAQMRQSHPLPMLQFDNNEYRYTPKGKATIRIPNSQIDPRRRDYPWESHSPNIKK